MAKNEISSFIARADADISRVIVHIAADSIAHRFRCRIPNAAATDADDDPNPNPDISSSIVPPVPLTEEEIDRLAALVQPIIQKMGIVIACCIGLRWIISGDLFKVIPMLKGMCDLAVYSIAVQLEQPKPIERCLSLSKYSRTPYLKGLKVILETDTGCRQEVEHHLEGTSRAVVASSTSTVDDRPQAL
ncbi:unnamed protein product [Trifolium pratense]|uniref:Uncharacterized protein n=1 Tax=Trifolium pratense TaxID=57577 RepID=A0ACB0JUR1_TRIPR|nr:unnamed protein product [Trifolium pratense]